MQYIVRRAEQRDSVTLAHLRFAFRAGTGTGATTEDEFVARATRWMAARLHDGSAWRAWIAERESTAVGTVWLQVIEKLPNPGQEPEWHGYISSLYVREAARGAGIGSALLSAALLDCAARGVDAVMLWPTPQSRRLYERHGFAVREDVMMRR